MHIPPATLLTLTLPLLATAHSWLDCVKTSRQNHAALLQNPNQSVRDTCNGWPRNHPNPGDWLQLTLKENFLWPLKEGGNTYACHPGQRSSSSYLSNAPMATAVPGETLVLKYPANGHARKEGSFTNRDPGKVRVYWAGKPATELVKTSDLTSSRIIAEKGFSDEAIIYVKPDGSFEEKANYFSAKLPSGMGEGRHMLVWTWAWDLNKSTGRWEDVYSTCFDVLVKGNGGSGGAVTTTKPTATKTTTKAAASTRKTTIRVITKVITHTKSKTTTTSKKATATSTSSVCSAQGYQGGMSQYPCTGSACAPCRYGPRTEGGYSAFSYTDGKCPWTGGWDCGKGGVRT
ncbi:hypothetical protein HK097_011455 [Rhizophlyctis rosea]|uniref:Lytic polysaccharide monooxygenase 9 n=1 Tax=Rhizophlyctis rosea TaxID=64517 RepID=A0AAD5SEB4_9FUNG|nr:hypothetical protein HK097_011455 [Rhizophlyctis rosea]